MGARPVLTIRFETEAGSAGDLCRGENEVTVAREVDAPDVYGSGPGRHIRQCGELATVRTISPLLDFHYFQRITATKGRGKETNVLNLCDTHRKS